MLKVKVGEGRALRDFQVKILKLFRQKQFLTCMAPRQHGKSTLLVMMLEDFIYRGRRKKGSGDPYCLVALKTMDQAYAVIFNRLMAHLDQLPEGYVIKQGSHASGHVVLTIKRPWFGDNVTVEFVGSGNLNAVKGRTVDFLLLDEYAFHPPTAWLEIFKPMTDDTDGKAFITSTIYGRNHFYQMCKAFEAMHENNPECLEGHIEFDIHTAGEWDAKKKRETETHYAGQGKIHLYRQEYLCDPDAIAAEEAPFSMLVGAARTEWLKIPENQHDPILANRVYVSIDIGKPQQNPAWEWYWHGDVPRVIGYKDDDISQDHMILRLLEKYRGKELVIIYPWDANSPSVEDGKTFLQHRQEFIANRGLGRLVQLKVLPRTKDKKSLLFDGLQKFSLIKWEIKEVDEGLVKMSGARLRVDATHKTVDYKAWSRNGMQHAADAYLYLVAAINNNVAMKTGYGVEGQARESFFSDGRYPITGLRY